MPRGGHRGGIFPVSGLPWGMNGVYKKRGLYHTKREDIFTPRWGFRFQNANNSPLPDGSSKTFEPDAKFAWPVKDYRRYGIAYAHNECRYLQPACVANDDKIKNYILNILEPSHNRTFSGIGLPNVCVRTPQMHEYNYNENEAQDNIQSMHKKLSIFPYHIHNISKQLKSKTFDENEDLAQKCFDVIPQYERGKIKKLYELVCESDIWRNRDNYIRHNKKQNKNIFPYVDENAAIVRDLQLSEVFYSKSNHRVKIRRHPIWINNIYVKKKIAIPYLYRRRVAREEAQQRELGMWRGKTYVE